MIGWYKKSQARTRLDEMHQMIDSIIDLRIRSQFNYPPPNADKVLDRTIRDGLFFFVTAGINFPGEKSLGEKSLSAEAYAIHKWLCNDAESKEKLGLRLGVFHLMHSLDGAEEQSASHQLHLSGFLCSRIAAAGCFCVSAAHSALESDWNEAQFNFNRAKKRLTLPGIKNSRKFFQLVQCFCSRPGMCTLGLCTTTLELTQINFLDWRLSCQ